MRKEKKEEEDLAKELGDNLENQKSQLASVELGIRVAGRYHSRLIVIASMHSAYKPLYY